MEKVIAAAVQAAPVFLDREATVDKSVRLIREAASSGAGLIVFPETFIPTYPDWVWRAGVWDEVSEQLYGRLLENSVEVPSETTETLGRAARRAKAFVSMGVNEREPAGGTVYNTQLYFGPDGSLLGKHRKLMPTGGERLVWGYGDGSTLLVVDTPFGRLGGLTCWENYMPLARFAMYAQGIDVWCAPTWDNSDVWVATLQHIAKEGRVYVVGATSCQRASDVPQDVPGRARLWKGQKDWLSKGNSTIVGPEGEILAGPLIGEEGIVYAEIDAAHARSVRHQFDPVGHYSRPDVFRLEVQTEARWAAVPPDGNQGATEAGSTGRAPSRRPRPAPRKARTRGVPHKRK